MPKFHRIADAVTADQWRRIGDLPGDRPLINGNGQIVKAYLRDDVAGNAACSLCNRPMSAHGWIDPPQTIASLFPSTVDPVTGAKVLNVAPAAPRFPRTFKKANEADRIANNEAENADAIAAGYTLFVAPQGPPPPVLHPTGTPQSGLPPTSVPPAGLAGQELPSSRYPLTFKKLNSPDRIANNKADEAHALGYAEAAQGERAAGDLGKFTSPLDPKRGDLKGLVVCPGDWIITEPTGERSTCKNETFLHEYAKVF